MSSPPAPGTAGPTSPSVALTSLALRRNFFREAARAMSSTAVVPSAPGPGPGPSGGPGGGTEVIQVTNVSPSASSEQMRTLFGFLGKIDELRLFPPDDSPLPVSSRVCFVKFHDPDSAVVAQHLTNTVFVDRALIVVPYAEVEKAHAKPSQMAGHSGCSAAAGSRH